MGFESLTVSAVVAATADRVYASWLDGAVRRRMTGLGSVPVHARVGSEYAARDAYVTGTILELEPGRRIVQSWRTAEFLPSDPDSRVELHLRDGPGGCEVMILHTEIPEGLAARYEQGWRAHVLAPMARYFQKPSAIAIPRSGERQSRRGRPHKSVLPPGRPRPRPRKKGVAKG